MPTSDLLSKLGWCSFKEKRNKKKALMMFKIMNGMTPVPLEEIFTRNIGRSVYSLRISRRNLALPALKDVRAHCYCASLVRTLYMTWRMPRHVFQACAPSRNSTKYRADDLCGNLISEYFCWMLGDPTFFSADHFLF